METTYIAFLRGINVGGNHPLKMDELKKIFSALTFKDVRTLLASGNVIFTAQQKSATNAQVNEQEKKSLTERIESQLEKTFGYKIPVILRSREELKDLAASDPFSGIPVTKDTRLYITFLANRPTSKLKIPYTSTTGDFRILRVTDGEVVSVLIVSPERNSTDLMSIIEKEFGKDVTTRNWNTVLKTLK